MTYNFLKMDFRSILFISLLILNGCGTGADLKINDDNKNSLSIKLAEQFSLGSTVPEDISIIGKKLVVREKYDYPYIKIYDLPSMQKTTSFGSRNDEKFPLENPALIGNSFGDKAEYVFLNDYKANSLIAVKLINKIPKLDYLVDLPLSFVNKYYKLLRLSDNLYWGDYRGHLNKGKAFIYNTDAKTTKWISYTPSTNRTLTQQDRQYYYYSFSAAHDRNQRIACAMKYFKMVEFYDYEGNLVTVNSFAKTKDSYPEYRGSLVADPNVMSYYNETFAGNKYFYATCIDSKQSDYNRNIGKMQVHVFDWNGTLKKIIFLDRMYLGAFTVDEKEMKLYILSFIKSDENKPVLIYDLKNVAI